VIAGLCTQGEGEGSASDGAAPALHILGSVTRKIIVTPDFDIGVRPGGAATTSASTGDNDDEDFVTVKMED
jgi:hypothetical protein